MPRFSLTARCVICNKEIAQSGPARQWVHQDGFYSKADHPAEPGGRQPYLMPKKSTAAAPTAPAADDVKKGDGNKAKSDADLKRRLRQGSAEIVDTEDPAARRRRLAAMEQSETHVSEADAVARKLRQLRHSQDDSKN